MQEKKIFPGLTTTPKSDWRKKTEEIEQLGIKAVSLFPTFLKLTEREELYSLLEKTSLEEIPHVHLRDDMELKEVDYFLKRWRTQVFNIHPNRDFLKFLQNEKIEKIIFVENGDKIGKDFWEIAEMTAGVCLDFSHWKARFNNKKKGYDNFKKLLEKKKIGCCHISAVQKKKENFWEDNHWFENLSDFDYLLELRAFLPNLISLELENSFKDQLRVKKYLEEKIL